MATVTMQTRAQVADAASAVIANRMAFHTFEAAIPTALKADPLIDELVDLIEHEPGFGGILSSTSARDHAKYMERVHEIIAQLRGSSA